MYVYIYIYIVCVCGERERGMQHACQKKNDEKAGEKRVKIVGKKMKIVEKKIMENNFFLKKDSGHTEP